MVPDKETLKVDYDGQTEFELGQEPNNRSAVLSVNSAYYRSPIHFRIDGRILTWTSNDFQLDPEDDVWVSYAAVGEEVING